VPTIGPWGLPILMNFLDKNVEVFSHLGLGEEHQTRKRRGLADLKGVKSSVVNNQVQARVSSANHEVIRQNHYDIPPKYIHMHA
jgi:hypothetical protein